MKIKTFIFNPFQENTYVVSDDTGACVVIDPGCSSERENEEIAAYIKSEKLDLVRVLCTHLHVDHILGNAFFSEAFGLKPWAHKNDEPIYNLAREQAQMFGLMLVYDPPAIDHYVAEGDLLTFGETHLKVLFVPGHSPGGICFYAEKEAVVFVGDCLFSGSVGRTDLWGGDHHMLISRIKSELLTLPERTMVYSGHGPSTTIGEEKENNPYLV